MREDIKFGITYPAGQQKHCDLGKYVETVERVGFDSFWVIDNLGSGSPGLECLTVLAYAAARSTALQLGTSVMLLPLRSPIITTQACNTIDVLSNGRFILGVGVGDSGSHEGLGANPKMRGKKTSEYLELIQSLWERAPTQFSGPSVKINNYQLTPYPIQTPHPPIWVGGHSSQAITRAAHYADGFITVGAPPEHALRMFEDLDRQAVALGRGPLARVVHLYLGFAENTQAAAKNVNKALTDRYQRSVDIGGKVEPHFLGTEDDIVEVARKFLNIGVTHFILDPTGDGPSALNHAKRFITNCRETILTS